MKVTCQSLCLLIEEADLGWEPDQSAWEHLRECKDCQLFFTETSRLRHLMGNLGTVQAPADFDFRLRARLAQEKPGRAVLGGFSFGWRTATVAALVLVLGAVVVFRGLRVETPPQIAKQPKPAPTKEQDQLSHDVAAVPSKPVEEPSPVQKITNESQRASFVPKRINTKDLSSSAAPVVRREEQVADAGTIFPIEATSEPLNVSLDDGSGVPRTISLPRVSFGSQRFVAGEPAFSKTSGRIDW
ncbi:MAG TPA: hypothetical protein VIB00_09360 [Pyrinomonadaceae bacterium]|jgi:hypothetical protein